MLKDHSYTFLFGSKRKKSERVFDLLGELDELNTVLGIARAFTRKISLKKQLYLFQQDVLRAGSLISLNKSLGEFRKKAEILGQETERVKDRRLKRFILPGKNEISAFLHLSRVVCRRAERAVVACNKRRYLPLVEFLNELSLLLFWIGVKEESKRPTK